LQQQPSKSIELAAGKQKYKLFASYLQQKPSKSIESVAAKQKQSNDIAKT